MPPRSGAAFETNLSVERPDHEPCFFSEKQGSCLFMTPNPALGSFVPALAVQSILDPASRLLTDPA
jgi:hypothetical protein